MKYLLLFLSIFFFSSSFGLPSANNCQGKPNLNPIFTNDPVLIATTTNGKLYQANQISPPINVLHVYGTAYEMGKAHGILLKDQIHSLVDGMKDWIYRMIDQYIDFLPKEIRILFETYGVDAVLDVTYLLTEEYTPQYFFDEIQGLADGSGIDYMDLVRVHMFPELIKAQCSMFGTWGPAIANTTGSLYQLRALDWSTDGPFQQFPTVIVYHPSDNGHDFSILTWSGFIGALTGYSSAPMGICEKVWLHYNGTSSRSGIPFHFLLRDILQFDADIDQTLSRIASAERTCSIFIGLGDHTNTFRAVEYSYQQIQVWNDYNFPAYKNHPRMPGLVFIDKHTQPSEDPCMGSLMQQYYGSLDAVTTIRYITALEQTGDMHIAIYDFANQYMYVSNASPYNSTTGSCVPAYERPFTRLDMGKLFKEKN
jgi:hypothetical protein